MASLDLRFASGEHALSVRRFAIRESLGEPFDVQLEARSPHEDLNLNRLVGAEATFRLASAIVHAASEDRSWSGICTEIELLQVEPTGLSTYRLALRPRLSLMDSRRNHRVFQHLSLPEIAEKLLEEWRIPVDVQVDRAAYPRLPMKVQYGESDGTFLRRILEDAGIDLYFRHDDQGKTRVVLHDALHLTSPRSGSLHYVDNPNESAEREFITQVRMLERVASSRITLRDVDFRRGPNAPLFGRAIRDPRADQMLEHFEIRPGAFMAEMNARGDTPVADDRGAVRHDEKIGQWLAQRRAEEAQGQARRISFLTNVLDLAPGLVFTIDGHPRMDLSAQNKLLVTGMSLHGAEGEAWTFEGTAVFAQAPHRPARVTPKPDVRGVESAMVVGPPGEEIHTDEFGRVRIQFAWDREGNLDEQSSCWVRVSQAWAGAGHGVMTLPRVGQEVLIGFVGGDPDQPIVVGQLHGGMNPVPYKLPVNKAVTGWKTASTPQSGGYNELRFDDTRGNELVHVRAERNLTKLVKVDEHETTGRNRVIEVGERLVLTNGQVSIILDGPNLTIEGKGKIAVTSSEDEIVLRGAPNVFINPAPPKKRTKQSMQVAKSMRAKKSRAGFRAERFSEGVELFGTAAFRDKVRMVLAELWATRTGRSVLRKIARTGHLVRIAETLAPNGACKPIEMPAALRRPDGQPGPGSSSVILFNPAFRPEGAPEKVVLCRQLVHAWHNATGMRESGEVNGVRLADLRAIGIGPSPRRGPTENRLRKELRLPERMGE